MGNLDEFMQEQYLPFYKRVVEAFELKHPTLWATLRSFIAGRKNHYGMRLTENGATVGEYTMYLDGISLVKAESGDLKAEVHTPFGVLRPYVILEKSTLEQMVQDEEGFVNNLFATKMKYVPEFTLKFLK